MKQLALSALLLAGCMAAGQEFPRFELSTGYAYGRVDNAGVGNQLYAQGVLGSFAANIRHWAALEVSAGAQYNNQIAALQGNSYALNSGFYSFLGGPRVSYRSSKMMPFVHGLFGIGRALDYSRATFDPNAGTVYVPYQSAFGAAIGGGVDYGITRRVALRTQGDYFLTQLNGNFGLGNQNNFRAVAGLVFSFGSGRSGFGFGLASRGHRHETRPSTAVAESPAPPPPTTNLAPTLPPTTIISEPVASAPATSEPSVSAPASVATSVSAPATTTTAAPVSQPSTATYVTPPPAAPRQPAAPPAPMRTSSNAPAAAKNSMLGYIAPRAAQTYTQTAPAPPPAAASAQQQQQQQEESLGDIARRYREQKKKKQRPTQ